MSAISKDYRWLQGTFLHSYDEMFAGFAYLPQGCKRGLSVCGPVDARDIECLEHFGFQSIVVGHPFIELLRYGAQLNEVGRRHQGLQ